MISFANGGPHSPRGIAVEPVDYKGGELSNLTSSEFHHITVRSFLIKNGVSCTMKYRSTVFLFKRILKQYYLYLDYVLRNSRRICHRRGH